ncbi:VOC family protein [Mameliella alba]|nr:VOC family protein [Mameliella alba]MBY6170673.1 VOC family protein [Mameliella alba]MBY6175691.1 VOC family protein [Mameliella alba]
MHLALISILVPSYEAGLTFFVDGLGFDLIEDSDLGNGKRWVRVAPEGAQTQFLLARAVGDQSEMIGKQGGGRVWLFLHTPDFARDRQKLIAAGAVFEEDPRQTPYGTVAVFNDPFGNRWDLIQPATAA